MFVIKFIAKLQRNGYIVIQFENTGNNKNAYL